MTYLNFFLQTQDPKKKTRTWYVETQGGTVLGFIAWYSPWRKYCFYPAANVLFEQDCLRDIAKDIEAATKSHKNLQRATRYLNDRKPR